MKYLYLFFATLVLCVLAVVHVTAYDYLREYAAARQYNTEQLATLRVANECVQAAKQSQYVVVQQSDQICALQKRIDQAVVVVTNLKKELARTMEQLEKAGMTIKDLTDLNSKSAGERDQLEKAVIELTKRLNDAVAEIETLRKQVPAPKPPAPKPL
jgi:TolA-binding protein